MKNEQIQLTRAAYIKPVIRALIKNGLSPEYYFKKVDLPLLTNENLESLFPLKPFWILLNMVAMDEQILDFGAQVAELTPWHETWSLKH